MNRTTIMLPSMLKNQALNKAREMGISLGEFIRLSMKAMLTKEKMTSLKDSLLSDTEVYSKKLPKDLALNHDDYLYGDDS